MAEPSSPPTPALEGLSEDSWRALRELAVIAERFAPLFEEAARYLRSYSVCVGAAKNLRAASSETQMVAMLALLTALREATLRVASLSAADTLSKFSLAIAPAEGREN